MLRRPVGTHEKTFLGIASIALLLVGYSYLSHAQQQVNPRDRSIPSWSQMWNEGLHRVMYVDPVTQRRWEEAVKLNPELPRPEPQLLEDSKATGTRLLVGLALSIVGSLVLGVLMGCFQRCEACLLPPLAFLAKIPATAALPVFFVLLQNMPFEWYFAAVIIFGVLPPMAQSIYLATRVVPDAFLHKAYTLGASGFEVIWNIIVRSILPHIIDATRLAIGPAIVYLIAAEMLCSASGFGYRIRYEYKLGMTVVFPYLMILAAFGFAMDYGLRWLQRKVCPWHVPEPRR